MAAQLIKGMPIANKIREEIIAEVEKLKGKGINPKLAVLLVGDDEASVVYARSKEKVGDKLGIGVELTVKPADTSEEVVLGIIDEFNADESVHGILVELPLPKAISKERVMAHLDPKKDVDGVHPINRGYLLGGQEDLALIPATPLACVELMARSGVEIRGKRVTLVGRGDTVGRPLASLLIKRDATLTICHTKTKDIPATTRAAEIVVVAAGRINLVTGDMLSPGQVVIDAGINPKEEGGITGDVEFDKAEQIVDAITPVPGGVGSLTTTVIMNNLLKAIALQGEA
ncbi:MAG: bifunctional 5,10-methylenetetrahydrofolate dehydrogenase/5,10-methenyltetrahydrofolate cyclohydrolase [Deltaproteobacteria bacterium]|nr:bifunctional 5,10-methylenetetrahydrofolate dehydrogenase/5,10-methenyltetrahydrofolate cyclohydrolase [Deltaproteobacteria bacterium]MBW2084550.1 bifunctional 5,10-methylenetetrahydrofolate dehydrogenase/5,10-methenyltetrahydrofolate cyclohydrolase [Deltaproteobacteria bacterium]